MTVYQVGDPTPVEVYEEVGCAEDPNPGLDGGRVRDTPTVWLDCRRDSRRIRNMYSRPKGPCCR